MGPVLAVQAQKWLERWREFDAGKRRLFATLMATRAERVSPEHVRALNMIDITYSGAHRFLGLNIGKPSRQEKVIVDKWRTYLDMLDPNAGASAEKRDEGFNAILRAMAEHLSYDFNDVLLRRGAYYPSAHVDQESEHKDIRAGLLRMLTGKQKLSVELETTRNDELSIAYAEALGN